MNERTKMIAEYLEEGYSVSELARRRGISRKTAWKWIRRYERLGARGLEDQSRAPARQARAISEKAERAILEFKARWPLWGAPKIRVKLLEAGAAPSESTISNVLRRHGLSRKLRRTRRQATPSAPPLEHCQEANALWCADFKGWFYTGDGRRCEPLTISDAHSRYLLCCQAVATSIAMTSVQPLFVATFREYGLPRAIRTDNGPPFASSGLAGLTELSVWWLRLGIDLERIQPGHPQQNGRHERMHRTLKEAVARPPRATHRLQQKAFEGFRQHYNCERPHEALGQKPPADFYEPSPREYPDRLDDLEYPDQWEKRAISPGGQMRWKGAQLHLSHALHHQTVGLEPIGDGQWHIHFAGLKLGHLDERRGRIEAVKKLEKAPQK